MPIQLQDTIILDPAVELREVAPRPATIWSQGPAVRRGSLLLHHALETVAMAPPIRGLTEFLDGLRTPTRVGELVDGDDVGSDSVTWQLLRNAVAGGYAHVVREGASDEIAAARAAWRSSCAHARRTIVVSAAPLEVVLAEVGACVRPPRLRIAEGRSLDDLEALALAFRQGDVRVHGIDVVLPPRDTLPQELVRAARDLLARAVVTLPISSVAGSPLVAQLVTGVVPVVWRLPIGADLLSPDVMTQVADAASAARISGIELVPDWQAVAKTGASSDAVLDAIAALENRIGDVRTEGLATDDEITQASIGPERPPLGELVQQVRSRHLERRATYLEQLEGKIVWGQDPAGEELWIPLGQDLLPSQPALLALGDGAVLVDVGGGFGRVARRLCPQVGATGVVVSIDKEPLFLDRARDFASAADIRTIQFRVGLGQRLPLGSETADAAVLEWGGEIHRDGLLTACIREMQRVVRTGGRVAITYRLSNIDLGQLDSAIAPYPTIYPTVREAIADAGLEVIEEKFWGVKGRISEAPLAAFEERFIPRLVDDLRGRTVPKQRETVDLIVTLVARRRTATP